MLRERKTKSSKVHDSSRTSKYRASNSRNRQSKASCNGLVIALFSIGILILLGVGFYKFSKLNSFYPPEPHDLLIIVNVNGAMYTMDDNMPKCKAICIDVTTGKFVYISTNKKKLWHKCLEIPHKSYTAIDASQYVILPGLIDTHAHIMMQGAIQFDKTIIDLSTAKSFKNMMQIISNYTIDNNIKKGSWIKGIGYDDTHWYDWYKKGEPTRFILDEYISDYKLLLYRIDLHALLINTLALDSIKHTFPTNIDNINGGKAVKNEDGELTGLFIDNAKKLVTKHIHPYYGIKTDNKHIRNKKYKQMLVDVIKECNKNGLTSIHDMDETRDIIENVYKPTIDNDTNQFNLRLNVYVHGSKDYDDNEYESELFPPTAYNKYFMYKDRLTVSGVKLFLDGALGSWGAKLIDPYCDRSETNGIWRYQKIEDYYNDIKLWHNAGWQLSTHAIGDKANRVALNMYNKLIKEYNIKDIEGLRLRIEHAQIVEPVYDLPRFGELSVIANMQPTHATSDLEFAEKRLKCRNKNKPNRMLGAYAWKSMLKNGVKLTFGSDFPAVGKINPFLGIYAAFTRKTIVGYPDPDGWFPNEKVSMMEILKAYTIDAAYASFQEEYIGSISPDKFADFIIIDRDLFTFHGEGEYGKIDMYSERYPAHHPIHIAKTNVVATFFGGKMVFHNESFPIKYLKS